MRPFDELTPEDIKKAAERAKQRDISEVAARTAKANSTRNFTPAQSVAEPIRDQQHNKVVVDQRIKPPTWGLLSAFQGLLSGLVVAQAGLGGLPLVLPLALLDISGWRRALKVQSEYAKRIEDRSERVTGSSYLRPLASVFINLAVAWVSAPMLAQFSPSGEGTKQMLYNLAAKPTTAANSTQIEKEIGFLEKAPQQYWLSKSQKDLLDKKRAALVIVSDKVNIDKTLRGSVDYAITGVLDRTNCGSIYNLAKDIPSSPRFQMAVAREKRDALLKKLPELKASADSCERLKAQEEKQRVDEQKRKEAEETARADFDAYLEVMMNARKEMTRIVVADADARGITWDSENDPIRLEYVREVETYLKPKVYDSAPPTLSRAQVDEIWQEIKASINSNL
jgi:hypothetical protein